MTVTEAINICNQFAIKHKVIFVEEGEVGFGRKCVGFLSGSGYVDFNPYIKAPDYEHLWPMDERLYPPSELVPNVYHKHDCLCVLVRDEQYDLAKIELALWVEYLYSQGEIEIVPYETGAQGIQALFTGFTGRAVRFKVQEATPTVIDRFAGFVPPVDCD